MEGLKTEFEKLAKKQKTTADDTLETLSEIISLLKDAQGRLASSSQQPTPPAVVLPPLASKILTLTNQTQTAHKDFASTLSKYGSKVLEKRFKPVPQQPGGSPFQGHKEVLDRVITEHLVREGRFAAARVFESEGGGRVEGGEDFAEMYAVLGSLRGQPGELPGDAGERMDTDEGQPGAPDLGPALAWARRNAAELYAVSSHLEFELHKCRFVQMREEGRTREELVAYARAEIGPWSTKGFEKEIAHLLTSLLFPAGHPLFSSLAFHPLLQSATALFIRTFCTLHRLPPHPPLLVSTSVGHAALPALGKIAQLMQSTSGLSWSLTSELPIDIPLPAQHRYHSIFVCPVTREAYDGGEANPPAMLPCGHVVSREAVGRLVKGREGRVKCPYCPREGAASECVRVHF
ncbi:hypothetical protein DFJ74DRAFT_334616 [Hyaloraphidium curvatum]|nr:hypothetical protein DFJ74DRAFT_334616 [Hyaloraphidium curvatum]